MRARALLLAVLVMGCAPISPERMERDRAILAAAQPCRDRYPEFFHSLTVDRDGNLSGWYREHLVGQYPEAERCINEALKTLKVGPHAPGRLAKAGPASVATQARGAAIVAPVLVNGVKATLLVDTGAGITIVRPEIARQAGIQIARGSPKVSLILVGGGRISVPYATARSLSVGDAAVEDLAIGVFDAVPNLPEVDGILGNNFLAHFKVTLDRQRERLALEPLDLPAPEIRVTQREWQVPAWAAGDEWRMRWNGPRGAGTYAHQVDGEEDVDDIAHYVIRSGSRRIYFVKATLGWHFEKQGDAVKLRRSPPMAWDWPLSAGKTWETRYEREEDAEVKPYYGRCLALGETSVSVPAGVFTALFIRCRNRAGRTTTEYWYVEEVKNWVRRRSVLAQGDRVDELVSYSPASH